MRGGGRRRGVAIGLGLTFLVGSATLGVGSGSVHVPVAEVVRALVPGLGDAAPGAGGARPAATRGGDAGAAAADASPSATRGGGATTARQQAAMRTIVRDLRLPRVLLAALVGMGLTAAGALYQSLLRNPLAEPYLLGVSSGAGAGAVLSVAAGLTSASSLPVPLAAFAGSLAASAVIVLLARVEGRTPVLNLVLAGVALGAFLSALTALMLFRAEASFGIVGVLAWLLGSLAGSSWSRLLLVAPFILVPLLATLPLARLMNVLLLGEEQARHLGLPVERVKLLLIGMGALLAAGCVAGAGVVGFVGLVVPHAVRLATGPDHRVVLPVAVPIGGGFLIVCDLLARSLFRPTEVPVGVVTALFGAPFFLYLLHRHGGVTDS